MTDTDSNREDGGILDLFEGGAETIAPEAAAASVLAAKRRRLKIMAGVLAFLLIGVGALFAWYLANNRKPLTQLPGAELAIPLPTYKTSLYNVERPLGVAVTPDGSRVYVTQSGGQSTTLVLDHDGNKIGELKPPASTGAYHVPVYVAVASDGRVYVGDRAAGTVYIYDASGAYLAEIARKDETLKFSPLGLAVAADGTVYIADVGSAKPAEHRILVLAPDGTLVKTLGQGELNYPNQLILDAAGNVYVTDSNNGRLAVFDTAGRLTSLVAHGVGQGDLGLPRGLGIDDRGRIFVVDATDHMIRMYTKAQSPTQAPTFVGNFGDQGIKDGQFMFPNGLAVDARARVYVADRENNRIQVWGF